MAKKRVEAVAVPRTTKGQETYSRIVEAAMKSFAQFGDRNTTFQSIANLSGVSQPLVAKYFKTREAVFPATVEQFLGYARKATLEALDEVSDPREKLKQYIRISIRMFRERPEIFKIYLLLHYHAGFDEHFKDVNTEIKNAAVNRIASIIDEGIAEKIFRECNSKLVAKTVHCALVGVLLSNTTEHAIFTDQQLQSTLEKMVFNFLDRDESG